MVNPFGLGVLVSLCNKGLGNGVFWMVFQTRVVENDSKHGYL
jgi:hypothetical protein